MKGIRISRALRAMALAAAVLAVSVVPVRAQEAPSNAAPPVLERPYEVLRNFFNYYALVGFDYDTNGQYLLGGLGPGSAEGINVGGGITGTHNWVTANFSLSYRGNYRDYFSSFGHANDQSLIATYEKRWKRWRLDVGESGGILNQEGAVYGTEGSGFINPSIPVQSNAYSTAARYEQSQVAMTYTQTYRLSYTFSGGYLLQRFNSGYAAGFGAWTGSGAVNYRLSRRTTVSGTYSHSLYQYQRGVGSNDVDNIYLTLSHFFESRVSLSASAGGTRASGAGAVIFPAELIANGASQNVFVLLRYNSTNYLPYFSLTASKSFGHTDVYLTGTDSVTPGNGQVLTTRALTVTALVNHQLRRSNISLGGYYDHLSGIASPTTLGGVSTMRGVDANFSYNLLRHLGLNARYDYLFYGSYGFYNTKPDNHFMIGLYFESKDIPLGLY